MGILGHFKGRSVYLSALSGHLYGCLQPFLIALVCAEVEFKTIQKDPHPRNLEQGSIVIQLRIFVFVRTTLIGCVLEHSNPCA